MNKLILLVGVMAALPLAAVGQEAKGAQPAVDAQATTQKPEGEKKAAVVPPKPSGQIKEKRVVYGGYLVDFAQTEKKRSLFSLKKPIEPGKDHDNLWYYPGTDKISGVVLFSIKF